MQHCNFRRTEKWPTELRSKKWLLDNEPAPAYVVDVDVRNQMDNVIKTGQQNSVSP